MDAALGGHTDSLATGGLDPTASAPGGHDLASGGHGSSPIEPATGAAGGPASTAPGATAPADGPSQAADSGAGRPAGRTTAIVPLQPVVNAHGMRTRGKDGIRQPVDRLNLHAAPLSPVPSSVRTALTDPAWRRAMQDEFDALQANDTWTLVPRPSGVNLVTGKWVFRHKFKSDGSLDRYKARWVLRGFTQRPGIDYDETFSLVVKPATIRTVLTLALSHSWPIHQLDVKNAFLHGILNEIVYCVQPSGFVDTSHPDYVCRLNKSLYGLKQAPRAWHHRFASHITSLGFVEAKTDSSLFIYSRGTDVAFLLLYVDDIVLTASSTSFLQRIIHALRQEFSMTDMGALHHFLGVSVQRQSDSLFLSQRQYILDILDRAGMLSCKPCSTPVDTHSKLSADGAVVTDPSSYRILLVLFSISLLLVQISLMLSSRCASTCMTPGSLIRAL